MQYPTRSGGRTAGYRIGGDQSAGSLPSPDDKCQLKAGWLPSQTQVAAARISKQYARGATRRVTLSDFSKKCACGTPQLGAGLAIGGAPGGPSVLSSVALLHAATTLASKGLGAANRLIVACDTLKLRATSACASPFASLCMASRR